MTPRDGRVTAKAGALPYFAEKCRTIAGAMAKNTLIHPIDELRFGTYDPKDASQALKITEKLAWERIDRILHLDPKDRTFENTVLGL